MIQDLLQQLDLSSSEAKLYISLAEIGEAPAKVLAKRVGLQRTTAYAALNQLQLKGLVSIEKRQGANRFVANSLDAIEAMLDHNRKKIKQQEVALQKISGFLGPFFQSKTHIPTRVQFFEGNKNVEQMLYQYCKEWLKSILSTDSIWWGYQDHLLVQKYAGWLENYWKLRTGSERIQLFSNSVGQEVEQKINTRVPRRIIKPMPKGITFESTTWVCGDYVIMLVINQNPHYAIQIRDRLFASNLRTIFSLLWQAKF